MSANNDMMDTLTPEERAAIEDIDPAEQAALAAIAAGNESGTGPDGDDDDDDAAAGAKPATEDQAAAPAAAPAPAAAAAAPVASPAAAPAPAAEAPAPAPAPTVAPAPYRAELPPDHAEKKAAAEQSLADLAAKFKAGEIELDEFEAQRKTADAALRELERIELKAEIAQEMTAQSAQAQWAATIRRQFDAAKRPEAGGIDYDADEGKRNDLDAFVRTLGSNPANADKSMDWFLAEAHKRVMALHDIRPSGAAAPAPASAKAPAVVPRTPPVGAVVPSLSMVPGSGSADDVGGDKFADLDKLDGLELEAALSRLSEAERLQYAMGA